MLDLSEEMIIGRVACVYERVDANKLYGGIMDKFMLLVHNFEWDNAISLDTILSTSETSPVGFIVE